MLWVFVVPVSGRRLVQESHDLIWDHVYTGTRPLLAGDQYPCFRVDALTEGNKGFSILNPRGNFRVLDWFPIYFGKVI